MATILPHQGTSSNEEFTSVIDNIQYSFLIKWNSRDESWQLSIGITGSEPAMKTKVMIGNNLIAPYQHLGEIPRGAIYAVDSEGLFGRFGRNNSGIDKRFYLVHLTEQELEALL